MKRYHLLIVFSLVIASGLGWFFLNKKKTIKDLPTKRKSPPLYASKKSLKPLFQKNSKTPLSPQQRARVARKISISRNSKSNLTQEKTKYIEKLKSILLSKKTDKETKISALHELRYTDSDDIVRFLRTQFLQSLNTSPIDERWQEDLIRSLTYMEDKAGYVLEDIKKLRHSTNPYLFSAVIGAYGTLGQFASQADKEIYFEELKDKYRDLTSKKHEAFGDKVLIVEAISEMNPHGKQSISFFSEKLLKEKAFMHGGLLRALFKAKAPRAIYEKYLKKIQTHYKKNKSYRQNQHYSKLINTTQKLAYKFMVSAP